MNRLATIAMTDTQAPAEKVARGVYEKALGRVVATIIRDYEGSTAEFYRHVLPRHAKKTNSVLTKRKF